MWVKRRSVKQAMKGNEYKVLFNDVYLHVNILRWVLDSDMVITHDGKFKCEVRREFGCKLWSKLWSKLGIQGLQKNVTYLNQILESGIIIYGHTTWKAENRYMTTLVEVNGTCLEINRHCLEVNKTCLEVNRMCLEAKKTCLEVNRMCLETKRVWR